MESGLFFLKFQIIEGIIKAGLRSQTLAAKDTRIVLQINDDVRMFVDSRIGDPFEKMTDEMPIASWIDSQKRSIASAPMAVPRIARVQLWTNSSTREQSCKCKGQCSPEIVLHHQTPKGFALVAKQFFAPGEPVAEMRGAYCRTNTVPDLDIYIMDITRTRTSLDRFSRKLYYEKYKFKKLIHF
ncbi:hypothetical protein B9Z55_004992 [Caenorhabditis nigoni]|uniref:Uncharacterized protein n=1 Tax=Caenorhabditis nigoni TaxID=1611254 RepID=A0A2G5UZ96_9PELO|nr:hypothetical protein B9Z55_004992 [Caenorhabditis nigoni]